MKKLLCVFLCVSVLFCFFSVSVFAADVPVVDSVSDLVSGSPGVFLLSSISFSSYYDYADEGNSVLSASGLDSVFTITSNYSLVYNTTNYYTVTNFYLVGSKGSSCSFGSDSYSASEKYFVCTGLCSVTASSFSSSGAHVYTLSVVPPPDPFQSFVDGISDFGKILIAGGELSDGTEVDSVWSSIIGFIMDNTICLIPVACFLLVLAFGSIRKWYKG